MIPERLTLLLIKQKNHNKRFGEFEFEYFGGSDVVNKLIVKYFLKDPMQKVLVKVGKKIAMYTVQTLLPS